MPTEIRPGIRRLLRLVTRRTMQRDADEQIRIHLELRTKQLIGKGMSPSAARQSDACPGPTRRRCCGATFAVVLAALGIYALIS